MEFSAIYLLEGLRGSAADNNGEITVTNLADYTQKKVAVWVREQEGKKQTPWLEKSGGAKLILVRISKQPEPQLVDPVKVEEVPTTATLYVSSRPSGATVYVDEKDVGKTPLTLEIDTGIWSEKQIEVGLELEGYKSTSLRAKAQQD